MPIDSPPRLRLLITALAAAGGAAAAAPQRTEACHAASERDIAGLFDRWNASLQTGDPKKVVANYAARSVLLSTVSARPRLTAADKEDYFLQFLRGEPVGTIDARTISVDCNTALDAGLYTFRFVDGAQQRAHYTFTYRWEQGQWLITSHQSSALPEKP
jgi:uncharacterized protein (TIGR02246 family)